MLRKVSVAFLLLLPVFVYAQKDTVPTVTQLASLSLEDLMNIKVVTASGYMQTTAEAPSTITVITDRQIKERGYEQLQDALRDIPGIDMIHINGYAPTLIYFRGMYGAENLRALLMIDGIVENNILGSNDMAGPAYSLHNVQRIEIIWGPVSALYGSNAFGGVINIITKKGQDLNGVHAEKGFGSFNTSFGNLSMGIRKSKFEFSFAGSLYSTDGPVFSNRDPDYTSSYVDRAFSFNTAISYYSKKGKTTAGFRTYNTPMGWGTYANSPTSYLGLPSQGFGNQGLVGVMQRDFRGEKSGLDHPYLRTYFLQHEYKASDKLNFLARVTYRETGNDEDSYIYVTADATRMIRVKIASYSNRTEGEFFANYDLSAMHRFSAGLQYYQDNVEQGARQATLDLNTIYLADGKDTVLNIYSTFLPRKYDLRNNFGSFLQYVLNTSFLHKTNFTLGLRYDHNSYFGDAVSPRVAVVNQPNDQLTFKFQFGHAFRAPTNLEIYQTPPSSGFKLKQEKIRTYELNIIYAFSKTARAQLNLFRNELSDVIVLGNLSGLNPDKNPGEETINGIEGIFNMDMSKQVSAFLNFTYQDGQGQNFVTHYQGPIPGIAKWKGNAGITARVLDVFTVSVIENAVGQRQSPRTDPYGPVAGYFLTNFVIGTTQLFNLGVTASLSVQNIFNVKWMDPGFRTADGLLYSTVLEQPGISAIFKVGVNF